MPQRRVLIASLLIVCSLLGGYQWSPPPVRVVVIGDSLSDPSLQPATSWTTNAPDDWSINAQAVNGHKCWQLIPSALQRPYATQGEVLVIFCGTNDAGRDDWSLEVTAGWIEKGVERGVAAGKNVVVVTPPPVFRDFPVAHELRNERLAALRETILEIATRHAVEVADLWAVTWQQPDPEALFFDAIHFGEPGRRMMARVIETAVRRADG